MPEHDGFVFGLPAYQAARPPASDVATIVDQAAQQLLADLERAEQRTDHWRDERLSDLLVEAAMNACLSKLCATGLWGEENLGPSHDFWRIVEPRLRAGALQLRAREKPRGYAGDYQMLADICNLRTCDDPLGRAFDRYFLNQAAPHAVRTRTRQASVALVAEIFARYDSELRLIHVGAGPAIDIRDALQAVSAADRERIHVGLLDVDPEALEFAHASLQPLLPTGRLHTFRENLFRLPRRPAALEKLGPADVLFCPGLFDYLSDAEAAEMLTLLHAQLAPGGILVAGNFAPHHPSRAYMEWIGNWYLTYRTAEDMRGVIEQAGLSLDEFDVHAEPLGVQLFWLARRFG